MRILLLITLLLVSPNANAYTLNQWADSIRIAEGNPNYGILSVNTSNPRQVCKNTVTHAFRDFVSKKGNITDLKGFVDFLADRYCPISSDPQGNRNWKHNVYTLLRRQK